MTINHQKKIIFIHIPKNAGTSIINCLGPENVFMDENLESYKVRYKKYWKIYKKICVVRNPIDRFISSYNFSRSDESFWFSSKRKNGMEQHPHYNLTSKMNVNDYASHLYLNPNSHNRWTFPQTFFIMNKEGQVEIDNIIKYETMKNDLKKFDIDLNCFLNKSEKKDNIYIEEKTLNILYEMYYMDFINFNYNI